MRFLYFISRFIPQNFNDTLAIGLLAGIASLWILQGMSVIELRDDVNGALTVLFTLVVQFYFRKSKSE